MKAKVGLHTTSYYIWLDLISFLHFHSVKAIEIKGFEMSYNDHIGTQRAIY